MRLDYAQLTGRKFMLLGINKFQRDIETFFRELTVSAYLVADDAFETQKKAVHAKPVLRVGELSKDALQDALIIICAFDTALHERLLEGKGLLYGADFIRGMDLIRVVQQTEAFYSACAHPGKKIVVLGTGAMANKLMQSNPSLNVAYFIDNDDKKQGSRFFDRDVFPVSALASECAGSLVVIAAATDIVSIRKQLEGFGLAFGDDFYFYDAVKQDCSAPDSLKRTFAYNCAMHGYNHRNPCPVTVVGLGSSALHLTAMERLPVTIESYVYLEEHQRNGRATFQCREIQLLDDLLSLEHPPILLAADDTGNAAAYLAGKGFAEGKDFFVYHPIADYTYAEQLILTISDEPRYDISCDHTSRGMLITEDGGFAPCALMCKTYLGNVLYNSIDRLMQSTGARIAWLSTVNKTYSFCFSICNQISNPASRLNADAVQDACETQTMPIKCERLNISYDASCNLTCPSCRNHKITAPQVEGSRLELMHGEVKRVLPGIRRILDSYGEMFISKVMRELYFSCDTVISDAYVLSNGLLFNKRNYGMLMEKYKSVRAYFSIDAAVEATYGKLRGGSFKQLLENLRYAGELRKNGDLKYLCIIFVVQKENFREMSDFVRLGFQINADKIYFKVLTNRLGWTVQEFIENDVYNIDSPYHGEFLKLICDPVFQDDRVHLPLYHYRLSDETYFLY